jgi:hypothetical protein
MRKSARARPTLVLRGSDWIFFEKPTLILSYLQYGQVRDAHSCLLRLGRSGGVHGASAMVDRELVSRALYRKLADLVLEADRQKLRRPFALLVSDASGRVVFDAILNWRRAQNFDYGLIDSTHLPFTLLMRSVDGEELGGVVAARDVAPEDPTAKLALVAKTDSSAGARQPAGEPRESEQLEAGARKEDPATSGEIKRAHRSLFNFLINQIALANSFAKMTDGHYDAVQASRNMDKACTAYRSAVDLRERLGFSDEEQEELQRRIEPLRTRLAQLGRIDDSPTSSSGRGPTAIVS